MTTITIPKKLTKGEELVVIPRKEYEEYLHLRKVIPVIKMTAAEKREWQKAKKDYKQGEYITLKELEHEMDLANKRKS